MNISSLTRILICSLAANTALFSDVFGQILDADLQPKSSMSLDNPFVAGLEASYQIVQVNRVDLDTDGHIETIICYREPSSENVEGGLMILSSKFDASSIEWHVYFEDAYPEKAQLDRDGLRVLLKYQINGQEKTSNQTFRLGKEIRFRSQNNNLFKGVDIQASSTLDRPGISPANVFDGKLDTSWAENSTGTGSGEKITFEFKSPLDLGLIGILHGKYPGLKSWRDHNRLHRSEVTIETVSDRSEIDQEVDLGSDLGLGLYGDQIELRFTNKPILHFFKIKKKQVVSLEIEITSVLLGNQTDDVHISEVDFAQMISIADILNKPSNSGSADRPVNP